MGLFKKKKAWKTEFNGHEIVIANTLTDFRVYVDGKRVDDGKGETIFTYNSACIDIDGKPLVISLFASMFGDVQDLVVTGDIVELKASDDNREFTADDVCGHKLYINEKATGKKVYLDDVLISKNTMLSENAVAPFVIWIDKKPVYLISTVVHYNKLTGVAKTSYAAVTNCYGLNTICGQYNEETHEFVEK